MPSHNKLDTDDELDTDSGFSPQQLHCLRHEFGLEIPWLEPSPPTPSPQPLQQAPPEPAPKPHACGPSDETVEEMDQAAYTPSPLQPIRKQRYGSTKPVANGHHHIIRDGSIPPAKFAGAKLLRSRDQELDRWYTTMLNHKHKRFTVSG